MSDRVDSNRLSLKGIHMDSESILWKGNIPIDLVNDILLRLPAKAVGRCMCTCKKWYSLIKSTQFITSHFNRSKIRGHSILIVQEGCYSIFSESDTCLIKQESGRIPFPVMERDLYILGSCRGLILVRLKVERGYLVLLWNPVLEKFKVIDSIRFERPHGNASTSSSWFRVFALGFHEASNDYRVVRINRTSSKYFPEVDVYSFTEDTWHRVNGTLANGNILPTIAFSNKLPTYINGVVHWLAMYDIDDWLAMYDIDENMPAVYDVDDNGHWLPMYPPEVNDRFVILSFDFDNEVFKVMELPTRYSLYDRDSFYLELREFNGKLALFGTYHDWELYYTWVMMNYPVVESWTYMGCLFEHKNYHVCPLVCTKKGNCIFKHIWVVKLDMLLYLNAKEHKVYELEIVSPYECPVIVDFVESLVLLDVEDQVLEDHIP